MNSNVYFSIHIICDLIEIVKQLNILFPLFIENILCVDRKRIELLPLRCKRSVLPLSLTAQYWWSELEFNQLLFALNGKSNYVILHPIKLVSLVRIELTCRSGWVTATCPTIRASDSFKTWLRLLDSNQPLWINSPRYSPRILKRN